MISLCTTLPSRDEKETHGLVVFPEILGNVPRGLSVGRQADEAVHDVLILDAPVV